MPPPQSIPVSLPLFTPSEHKSLASDAPSGSVVASVPTLESRPVDSEMTSAFVADSCFASIASTTEASEPTETSALASMGATPSCPSTRAPLPAPSESLPLTSRSSADAVSHATLASSCACWASGGTSGNTEQEPMNAMGSRLLTCTDQFVLCSGAPNNYFNVDHDLSALGREQVSTQNPLMPAVPCIECRFVLRQIHAAVRKARQDCERH